MPKIIRERTEKIIDNQKKILIDQESDYYKNGEFKNQSEVNEWDYLLNANIDYVALYKRFTDTITTDIQNNKAKEVGGGQIV